MNDRSLGIALLGLGTVGSEVARILLGDVERLAARSGGTLALRAVVVRDPTKARAFAVPPSLLRTDALAAIDRDDVHIVVELMGGIEPAHTLMTRALAAGKAVVTANKAVVARHGADLCGLVDAGGGALFCEAAAVGAVPIVRALQYSLAGDHVRAMAGIVNGTCNYILSRMEDGDDYGSALAEAQRLGYAEADPAADVQGHDSAAKLAILAALAWDAAPDAQLVHCEGIDTLRRQDIEHARDLGFAVKLLALAQEHGDGAYLRVHPALVAQDHPLASVRGANNAVWVVADNAGELMFYGQGAGGPPTASAVTGDIVAAARAVRSGVAVRPLGTRALTPHSIDLLTCRNYCRISVADSPNVLSAIAACFGDAGVSIETCIQKGRESAAGEPVDLVFITHEARELDVEQALDAIENLTVVHEVGARIRVFA